jgi:hypothetical protein
MQKETFLRIPGHQSLRSPFSFELQLLLIEQLVVPRGRCNKLKLGLLTMDSPLGIARRSGHARRSS